MMMRGSELTEIVWSQLVILSLDVGTKIGCALKIGESRSDFYLFIGNLITKVADIAKSKEIMGLGS